MLLCCTRINREIAIKRTAGDAIICPEDLILIIRIRIISCVHNHVVPFGGERDCDRVQSRSSTRISQSETISRTRSSGIGQNGFPRLEFFSG